MNYQKDIMISNRVQLIIDNAKTINNYIDCDVIQQNIVDLESCTFNEVYEKIESLISAIMYRVGETQRVKIIKKYQQEILNI